MILVLGCRGQLAQSILEQNWNEEIVSLGSDVLDFSQPERIQATLNSLCSRLPRLILNAAAYTAVDKAESEPEIVFRVNAEAVGELGHWAHHHAVPVIHFSTDYVYPGSGSSAWLETDPAAPVNVYGKSKWAGEKALLAAHDLSFIFRISWVVSPFGQNFVKTMLRLGTERKSLQIVDDQIGSPMSALAIARLMMRCFNSSRGQTFYDKAGTYNLSSAPFVSWHGFAQALFSEARQAHFPLQVETLTPIASEQFPTPAQRPRNSRMSDQHFQTTFQDRLGPWTEHLSEIIRRLQ